MMKVVDVSEYILEEIDEETQITTMKLQKLCYYAQAWSLVWDERPLFNERMEAWANGPVCPALFDAHKGKFLISSGMIGGNSDNPDEDAKETIDAVFSLLTVISLPQSIHTRFKTACSATGHKMTSELHEFIEKRTQELEAQARINHK